MTDEKHTPAGIMLQAASHPVAAFLAGLRFLTVLPISWKSDRDEHYFKASLFWFPVIGLLIGLMTAATVFLLEPFLPRSVLTVFAIFSLSALSGFLHLDGLADSADGLLSARPKEKSLVIMRDSRTGAMGVIALIFILLIKFSALSSSPDGTFLLVLVFMPLLGRVAILCSMAILPYARTGGGLGELFYSPVSRYAALWALVVFLFVSLFFPFSFSLFVTGLISLLLTVGLFSLWCKKKIGGATGDTLGAVCELTEAMFAVCMTCTIGIL